MLTPVIVSDPHTFHLYWFPFIVSAQTGLSGQHRVYTGLMLRAHKEAVAAIKSAQKRVEKAKQERDKAKAQLKKAQARLELEKEQLRRSQERLES
jgi:hypothetical protein